MGVVFVFAFFLFLVNLDLVIEYNVVVFKGQGSAHYVVKVVERTLVMEKRAFAKLRVVV